MTITSMSASETPEEPFAPRTQRIIGRREFIDAISSAIADEIGGSHIFYFVAPGGIGKTRLLEEVGVIKQEWAGAPFRWAGIIDLYHADYHSPDGLRRAIADGLDPGNLYFQDYRHQREIFEEKQREGIAGTEIEKLRRELDEIFLREYIALAQKQRLVVCFDTLELIQYESDIVQQICGIQDVDTVIKNWLIEQVARFPNTVTLFAGRPRPSLQADFEQGFSQAGCKFRLLELKALPKVETLEYLDAMRERRSELAEILESTELRDRIFSVTQGRPIYLALLIDLLLHGKVLSEMFPAAAEAAQHVDEESIGKQLVDHLRDLWPPFDRMIEFLAHARKGLDAELVEHLMGDQWSAAEIRDNLKRMREFAFVKTRPQTEQLFLHDEVYDLFDHYFRDDPRYGRECEPIAKNYRQRLEAATSPSERARLMATLLYYELQVDPPAGYHRCYARWDEDAIKSHESDFDMRLRDEVLRFLDRYTTPGSSFYDKRIAGRVDRSAIDRDGAIRWIKRHIAQTKHQQAIEVAETILDLRPELGVARAGQSSRAALLKPDLQEKSRQLFDIDDALFWGQLLTHYGEALAYIGADEEKCRVLLKKAIELLSADQTAKNATEPRSNDLSAEENMFLWLRIRTLGRAYNNLGHFAWSRQRLGRAIEHYKTAIHFYRQLDILDELGASLNNLAYVYGAKGEISWAEKLADEALGLRRELGQKSPLALSLNTRGLIHNFAHQPHRARSRCEEALDIFEELQDQRGIGLACNALGHTLRMIANEWQGKVYSPEKAREMYEQALYYLEHAIKTNPNERVQLIEAYNERGAVQRDWALLEQTFGNDEAAGKHFALALEDFEHSLKQAGESFPVERADSLEDIADVFFRQSQYLQGEEQQQKLAQAEQYLDEAEKLIPFEYRLVAGVGFPKIEDPIEGMWQMMGKIYLARGHQLLVPFSESNDMADAHVAALLEATTRYTLAMIYLLKFAPNPDAHQNGLDTIYHRLTGYNIAHLEQVIARLKQVRQRVEEVAADYRADAGPLLRMIDDVLGLRSQLL